MSALESSQEWRATKPFIVGVLALLLLVGGVGVWSTQTKLSGAIVASGMVQLESNRQVVQHPEGGVVGAIFSKNGDAVQAGEVLIRFDDTMRKSELAIVEGQLFEILARKACLNAERLGLDQPEFPKELMNLSHGDLNLSDQIDGQIQLSNARKSSLDNELLQLKERVLQLNKQIEGAEALLASVHVQRDLVVVELSAQQDLLDRQLTQLSRVTALKREQARLTGETGRLESDIAGLRGQIATIQIEREKLQGRLREEAIATMRDLQLNEIELAERRLSLLETISRMEVRAPVDGVVYASEVFALKSVVQPAQPMMYIIPQNGELIVSARIESIHIDQIHVGQEATLRFSSFDQRTTPEIFGVVSNISADVFTDQATGVSFYRADMLPKDGEMNKLGDQVLLPGMPVEAYIKTGERTPLSFLLKPLTDYFNRSLRE